MSGGIRFPLVDSMRALAALSVVVFHAVGIWAAGLGHDNAFRPFLARLDVGVVVFLVISGFLLYRPYVQAAHHGEPPPRLGAYAWRRFLRIAPPYWVALAVAATVLTLPGVHGLFVYFAFGQIYSTDTIGRAISPAWTLGLEVTFYALLPLYAALMRRVRAEVWGVVAIFAGSMVYKVILFATGAVSHPPVAPQPLLVSLPGYLDEFALGMGLAVLSVRLQGQPLRGVLALLERRPGIAWGLSAAAFVVVSVGIGLNGDPAEHYTAAQYLARNALYGLVAVGVVLPAVVGGERRVGVRRVMALPALAWLGTISYGIYLWHWPVLMQLSDWGLARSHTFSPEVRWGIAGVALAILMGAVSYYVVERPALSLKRLVAS